MSGERAEGSERLLELIEKFRQKGATSPDTALTLEELGLPPRFKNLVHRRQGRLRGGVTTTGHLLGERWKILPIGRTIEAA